MDEISFDFVVVGSGTGMLAALAAAEAGLSVLIVEKTEYFGGSTALSGGGFWIPNNALLRQAGVVDSPERAREYLSHVTAGETPESRWETHVVHGPDAVDVLRRRTPLAYQWMTGYADYFPELPGGSATGRAMEPKPFDVRRLGKDRARLRPPALSAPFPMPVSGRTYKWLNLVARHPRGIVTGAKLLGLGVGGMAIRREYAAGGSALAAGLFAGVRAAKIPVWFGSPLKELVVEDGRVAGVVVTRDGQDVTVRAARGVLLSAGGFDRNAAMRHEHQSEQLDTDWCLGNPANTGEAIGIAQAAGADVAFMNESWWFPALPIPGPMPGPLLAERSLPGQIIVNQRGERFMNEAVNYMTAGQHMIKQELPVWMVFGQTYRNRYVFGGGVFPRQQLPKAWYDAGVAVKADTLAVKVVPGDLGTCGGIRADGLARALRPDGSVIEGLYASGNAAGNAFGRVYPGPGATIGQGLTYGYVAARHAAGKLAVTGARSE